MARHSTARHAAAQHSMTRYVPHLNGACFATSQAVARLLWQRQTEVHKFIKGMGHSMASWALQSALQLPSKDILDDTVAPAVGILPCFICLLAYCAFSFQLLVGRLASHSIQLCLYSKTGCDGNTDSWVGITI